MKDGHCHSCQHVVIEIAEGVCPQELLQIIANICLFVHVYESCSCLLGHGYNQVCDFFFISECVSTLLVVSQCGGLVYEEL